MLRNPIGMIQVTMKVALKEIFPLFMGMHNFVILKT
jgi:hypothetical protein